MTYQMRLLLSEGEQEAYAVGFARGMTWNNSWRPGGPHVHRKNIQSKLNWLSWMEGFASATNDQFIFDQIRWVYTDAVSCKRSW
jgi:hypothetical protein